MDDGHFVKRDRWNLKYHEKNNAAQCTACNRFQDGAQGRFAIAIDRKYGTGTAEALLDMGARKGKMKAWEHAMLADEYYRKTYVELKRSGVEKWW